MTEHGGKNTDGLLMMPEGDSAFVVDCAHMTGYLNGDRLPSIWVSRPVFDDGGVYSGRSYKTVYPYIERGLSLPESDENGGDALYFGGCFYDEGMDCTDPSDRKRLVDCFRAAEVFYRHSAGCGNAAAYLCLGYVYSYDRCEGDYWRDPTASTSARRPERLEFPREKRAFECFSIAARAGIPEACYKLGDMFKQGVGCEPNAAEAFQWYSRASKRVRQESPVVLGSIALRLASCFEEGLGCRQNYERALEWYEMAVSGLDFAVDNGEEWYEEALASARVGARRCRQEIES